MSKLYKARIFAMRLKDDELERLQSVQKHIKETSGFCPKMVTIIRKFVSDGLDKFEKENPK